MNEKLKVAIQGYEGSFHHIVADRCFGSNIEIHPCATFLMTALFVTIFTGQWMDVRWPAKLKAARSIME